MISEAGRTEDLTTRFSINITPSLCTELDRIAAESHESRASVARRLIERGLSVERKLAAIAEHVA